MFVFFTYDTYELIAGEWWLLAIMNQHKPLKETTPWSDIVIIITHHQQAASCLLAFVWFCRLTLIPTLIATTPAIHDDELLAVLLTMI